jgi:hypothetical protein
MRLRRRTGCIVPWCGTMGKPWGLRGRGWNRMRYGPRLPPMRLINGADIAKVQEWLGHAKRRVVKGGFRPLRNPKEGTARLFAQAQA